MNRRRARRSIRAIPERRQTVIPPRTCTRAPPERTASVESCDLHRTRRIGRIETNVKRISQVPFLLIFSARSYTVAPLHRTIYGGSMPVSTRSLIVSAALAIVCALSGSAAAQTSSTVAGTVKDTQGGIIPGATVTLVSETRGTTFEAVAGNTGDFVISNVPSDTYTIRVTMDGFKTTERKGIPVSLGERVAVGSIAIEVGTLAETVLVTGDAPMIQAQTGERSFTVSSESVENLPVSGRNFASFVSLAPGVVGLTRIDG